MKFFISNLLFSLFAPLSTVAAISVSWDSSNPTTVQDGDSYTISVTVTSNTCPLESVYLYKNSGPGSSGNGTDYVYTINHPATAVGSGSSTYHLLIDADCGPQVNEYFTVDYTAIPSNSAPSVSWGSTPTSVELNENYTVTVDATDSDGSIVGITIDNDLTAPETQSFASGQSNRSFSRTFYASGNVGDIIEYTAYATDDSGASSPTENLSVQIIITDSTAPSGGVTDEFGNSITYIGPMGYPTIQPYIGENYKFIATATDGADNNLKEMKVLSTSFYQDFSGDEVVVFTNSHVETVTSSDGSSISKLYDRIGGQPNKYRNIYWVHAIDLAGKTDPNGPIHPRLVVDQENRRPQLPTLTSATTTIAIGSFVDITSNIQDSDGNLTYAKMNFQGENDVLPVDMGDPINGGTSYVPLGATDYSETWRFYPPEAGLYTLKSYGTDPYMEGEDPLIREITINVVFDPDDLTDDGPPNPPKNLGEGDKGSENIEILWSKSDSTDVNSQEIYWAKASAPTIQLGPESMGIGVESWWLNNLEPDTDYQVYILARDGHGHETPSETLTVRTNLPPLTASINADVTKFYSPGEAVLSWTTSNATSVSVTGPGLSSNAFNGPATVTGLQPGTHTFTLTASGPTGTETLNHTLVIGQSRVLVGVLEAQPGLITPGGSSALSWSVEHADSVTISGGPANSLDGLPNPLPMDGVEPLSGLPLGLHTFTLTASKGTQTVSKQATVRVVASPIWTGNPPAAVTGATSIVGSLGGDLAVDNRGSANYSIPLPIPAGRSGLQPGLSLDYNSQGSNGEMGIGFSLSAGQSAITRGRNIYARDGNRRNVEFSDNDKLYLDGKRLIKISGTHLSDGAVYRTEIDSFSKITAKGTSPSGDPEYFKAETKSGNTIYYGDYNNGAPDAYQELGGHDGGEAYAYAISRVETPTGHFMSYHYHDAMEGSGEHLLHLIKYAGHGSTDGPAEIELHYNQQNVGSDSDSMRGDPSYRFIAGRSAPITQRLDEVVAKLNGSSTHHYKFLYEYAPVSKLTRLTGVNAYAKADVGSGWKSIPSTTFDWEDYSDQDPDPESASSAFTQMSGGSLPPAAPDYDPEIDRFADVDGDGLVDYVYWDSSAGSSINVRLSNGNGFESPSVWFNGTAMGTHSTYFADFDGDGRADLINPGHHNDDVVIAYSNGSAFTDAAGNPNQVTTISSINSSYFKDYVYPGSEGGPATYATRDVFLHGNRGRLTTADFTGDGRADILLHGFDGKIWMLESQGRSFSAPFLWHGGANTARVSLEGSTGARAFDGLYHIVLARSISNKKQDFTVLMVDDPNAEGYDPKEEHIVNVAYEAPISIVSQFTTAYVIDDYFTVLPKLGDYNGDGLLDYAWVENNTRTWNDDSTAQSGIRPTKYEIDQKFYILFSDPSGNISSKSRVFHNSPDPVGTVSEPGLTYEKSGYRLLTGDFNGDGITDVLYRNAGGTAGKNWSLRLYKGDGGFEYHMDPLNLIGDPHNKDGGTTIEPGFKPITRNYWDTVIAPFAWLDENGPEDYTSDDNANFLRQLDVSQSHTYIMDLNEDGMKDIVWINGPIGSTLGSDAGWWVSYSHGKGFDAPVKFMEYGEGLLGSFTDYAKRVDNVGGVASSLSVQPMYLNLDGRLDWVITDPGTGDRAYALSEGDRGDLVAKVTNGVDRTTKIAYDTITNDDIYTPGATVTYPIVETRSPKYVVSQVEHDSGMVNGSGAPIDPAVFSYQYSGYRTDLSGRGSLGFHSFVTLDHQTDLFKYQFLTQSFPTTGLTAREQTYRYLSTSSSSVSNFRLLSSHDNRVVFAKIAPASGKTLFPFISEAKEYRWEYSDTAHFSTSISAEPTSAPEFLFSKDLPAGHHVKITATSYFDGQSSSQSSNTGLATSYFPSDANGNANVVASTTDFDTTFGLLSASLANGNLTQLKTDFGDKYKQTVVNTYAPAPSTRPMMTGRVATTTSSAEAPNPETGTTNTITDNAPSTSFTYLGSTALVESVTSVSGSPSNTLTTTHTYDSQGRGRLELTKLNGSSFSEYTTFKATQFNDLDLPEKTEDAYGHETTIGYHGWSGQPVSVTDPNGGVVSTTYDALGRVTSVTESLFARTSATTYSDDGHIDVTLDNRTLRSAFKSTTTTTAQPTVVSHFDRVGRPIRTTKTGYGGQVINTDVGYDKLGRTVGVSLPTVGTPSEWTRTTYDDLGRVEIITAPNGTSTTNSYDGRTTTVTVNASDRVAQTTKTEVNAQGNTIKVWNPDPDSPTGAASSTVSLEFRLDGFGRMRETWLEGSDGADAKKRIIADYDDRGNQTDLIDPDKGHWHYTPNELGQTVSQTDPNGTVTTTSFDPLGRPQKRITQEASSGPTETAEWHYFAEDDDAATHRVAKSSNGWIGALQREEVETSGNPGFGDYSAGKSYTYNSQGLPHITLHHIDDDPSTMPGEEPTDPPVEKPGKFFYQTAVYTPQGLPTEQNYFWRPYGNDDHTADTATGMWHTFGFVNDYDSRSYLTSITDTHKDSGGNPDPRIWWTAGLGTTGYDELDRPVLFQKGSGLWTEREYDSLDHTLVAIRTGTTAAATNAQNHAYDFDGLGNLKSRSRDGNTTKEEYKYDNLNRLTERDNSTIASYALNGNIITKQAVGGSVAITAYHPDHAHAAQTYTYDGQTFTIDYDANGNLTERKIGPTVTHTAKWTGFDKPRWMAKGISGSEFLYGTNHQRIAHYQFDAMSGDEPSNYTSKKLYLGSGMEVDYEQKSPGGALLMDRVRLYVSAPGGNAGAVEFAAQTLDPNDHKALVYHYDHLGSIDLITDFGESSGTPSSDWGGLASEYSYNAWGERRDPTDLAGTPVSTTHGEDDDLTPRGFTGHEMLDDLGLVHMNGRIYDPLLGRFLSADPYIQFPNNLQNYNRYSYVNNNPLTYNDPDGHFINFAVGFVVGAVVDVGFQVATNYATGKDLSDISVSSAVVSGAASATGVGALAMFKKAKSAVDIAKRAKQVGYVTKVSKKGEIAREVVGEAGQQVLAGEAKKRIAEAAIVAVGVATTKARFKAAEKELREKNDGDSPESNTSETSPLTITPAPEAEDQVDDVFDVENETSANATNGNNNSRPPTDLGVIEIVIRREELE